MRINWVWVSVALIVAAGAVAYLSASDRKPPDDGETADLDQRIDSGEYCPDNDLDGEALPPAPWQPDTSDRLILAASYLDMVYKYNGKVTTNDMATAIGMFSIEEDRGDFGQALWGKALKLKKGEEAG